MNLAPIKRDHFTEAHVHDHEGFNDDQGTRRAVEPTGTEASEIASQGRMKPLPPAGTTPSHARATFSDPVADDIDPTSPESPEQTLAYQHHEGPEAEQLRRETKHLEPQQNIINDWQAFGSDAAENSDNRDNRDNRSIGDQ